ncbi:MAG: hypothetical protein C4519_24470 [Desulfobacteraceae bacterium]|nr:MAG: hypothetical protein C4519_24470 [Desulfobacteraceae bacterium]
MMYYQPYNSLEQGVIIVSGIVDDLSSVIKQLEALEDEFRKLNATDYEMEYFCKILDLLKKHQEALYFVTFRFPALVESFQKFEKLFVMIGGKHGTVQKKD